MNQPRSNGSLPRPTRIVDQPPNRNSGIGAAFLSGDIEDDDDESDYSQHSPRQIIPRKNSLPSHPAAGRQQQQPQQSQKPSPLRVDTDRRIQNPLQNSRSPPQQQQVYPDRSLNQPPREAESNQYAQPIPRPPRAAFIPESPSPVQTSPLAPHPLQAPKIPIAPVFASPSPSSLRRPGVKFSDSAIMRGNSEETLVARNTPKGAEFWRRFSVVVKEEQDTFNKPGQRSSWLKKNQSSASRMRGCVWITAIIIILGIGGLAALIWFMTHNQQPSVPKTLSGAADPSNVFSTTSSSVAQVSSSTKKALHTVTGDLPPPVTSTAPVPPAKRTPGVVIHDSLRRRHGKARID